MEIFFIAVGGKRLESTQAGEAQPLIFHSKEDAEAYVSNNEINNAIVMSSIEWGIELQHRIANRSK